MMRWNLRNKAMQIFSSCVVCTFRANNSFFVLYICKGKTLRATFFFFFFFKKAWKNLKILNKHSVCKSVKKSHSIVPQVSPWTDSSSAPGWRHSSPGSRLPPPCCRPEWGYMPRQQKCWRPADSNNHSSPPESRLPHLKQLHLPPGTERREEVVGLKQYSNINIKNTYYKTGCSFWLRKIKQSCENNEGQEVTNRKRVQCLMSHKMQQHEGAVGELRYVKGHKNEKRGNRKRNRQKRPYIRNNSHQGNSRPLNGQVRA